MNGSNWIKQTLKTEIQIGGATFELTNDSISWSSQFSIVQWATNGLVGGPTNWWGQKVSNVLLRYILGKLSYFLKIEFWLKWLRSRGKNRTQSSASLATSPYIYIFCSMTWSLYCCIAFNKLDFTLFWSPFWLVLWL